MVKTVANYVLFVVCALTLILAVLALTGFR